MIPVNSQPILSYPSGIWPIWGADDYFGVLKRWTGSAWVKSKLKTYTGSIFEEKPLKIYIDGEWKEIDTTGI